jgi:hypothetical protein
MRRVLPNLILVLVSVALALVGGELLLRLASRPRLTPLPLNQELLQEIAERYIQDQGVIRRQWFFQTPPPLAGSMPVKYDFRAEGWRIFDRKENLQLGTNFPKVFNFQQVRAAVCSGNGQFYENYPFPLTVFHSDPPLPFPRYRFYPYAFYASGLVTNRYGYRSPDFPPAKPPQVVRIAFLGGSTTVNHPRIHASYPEFVGFWLNKWARAKGLAVRFQVLNAARDGATSQDLSAIVRTELAHLAPDVIVYYEGSNQFQFQGLIELPPGERFSRPLFQHRRSQTRGITAWLINHSHLCRRAAQLWHMLADRLWGPRLLTEPPKPAYRVTWPPGVDERDPDPDNPALPLSLPQIVRDLKAIATQTEREGQVFVLCSFVWLSYPGLVIDRTRARQDPIRDWYMGGVYGYLNWKYWPATYADIRRFADFQNRVFRNFARKYGVGFIDVAARFPQDYRLFFDGIHMTEEGVRLRAWFTFLGLKDLLAPLLASGALPRRGSPPADSRGIVPAWPVSLDPLRLDCRPPEIRSCPGISLDLGELRRAFLGAQVRLSEQEGGRKQAVVVTSPLRYSYAAELPLAPPCQEGRFWLEFELEVGPDSRVSLGVLNHSKDTFLANINQADTKGRYRKIYLAVPSARRAGYLMISNALEQGGRRSYLSLRGIRLYCGCPKARSRARCGKCGDAPGARPGGSR